MNERQLHFFWERSLFPKTRLKTTLGEPLRIISKGEYNENESGPDFLNARVLIGEIEWAGNVEIHLRSSDWKKHRHHNDPQYDNVILHVVFFNDARSDQEISTIPTMVVSDFFDFETIQNVARGPVINQRILCKDQLHLISDKHLIFFKESILYKRLEQKTNHFNSIVLNPREILYKLLADAFGKKVNKLPFLQLTNFLPFIELISLEGKARADALLNTFHSNQKMQPVSEIGFFWKEKGLRPKGFPSIRVLQFAGFLSDYDFNYHFVNLTAREIYFYLLKIFDTRNAVLRRMGFYELSSQMKVGLIVNAFAPFVYWYGKHKGSDEIIGKAIELLRLTAAEDNKITRIWKKTSLKITNAADSQAHLGIYQQFCREKSCLLCPIGQKLVKGEIDS